MANTSEEPPILTIPEVIGINELCRLCGTQCDKLIGIYSVEGVQSDMAGKVNAYLPIKVDESDHLPLQCCWQCTSTLLAWHDLFITSIEVDKKLRSCHFVTGEEDIKSYDTNEGVLVVGNEESLQSTEELSHEQPPSINPTVESPLEQCKICDKTFNSLKALKTHMHMIHSMKFRRRKSEISDSSFSCNWCNKSYTKKHDLSRHLQSKHGQQPSKSINLELLAKCKNGGAYKCDFCSKTFNKASNFLRHRTLHTNDKAYCCNLCGKNFRLSMSLSRHIREVHEGNRSFKCQLCKKGFKNKWSLNEHLNIHGDARPYICDVCGKAFKQKASLYIHKQYHSSEQDFECNVCHKKFTRKHNVKQHILSHLQQKSFICECCGAQFETKRGWGRHCRKCSVSG